MKFIYVMVLFSSMLFGMQKQIILGSYSVQKNALNALVTVQNQIKNDEKLKILMERGSVKVMSSLNSGYAVVSVNIFTSYTDILPAIKLFKTYYKDAYVLKYEVEGLMEQESMKEIEKKVEEDLLLKKKMLEKKKMQEEARLEKLAAQEAVEEERLEAEEAAEMIEATQNIEEVKPLTPTKIISRHMDDKSNADEEFFSMQNYYLLGGLGLLVLFLAVSIICKKTSDED